MVSDARLAFFFLLKGYALQKLGNVSLVFMYGADETRHYGTEL